VPLAASFRLSSPQLQPSFVKLSKAGALCSRRQTQHRLCAATKSKHCHRNNNNNPHPTTQLCASSSSYFSSQKSLQLDIELPLLVPVDLGSNDDGTLNKEDIAADVRMLQPLPSAHLPEELSTWSLYGLHLSRPLYRMIVLGEGEDDVEATNTVGSSRQRIYGHIAYQPSPSTLVGAIGCASQVLLGNRKDGVVVQPPEYAAVSSVPPGASSSPPVTVVCRGIFRFMVKQVLRTIPYPIAVVDELMDDDDDEVQENTVTSVNPDEEKATNKEQDEEDDDEEENEYATLDATQLVVRTLATMRTYAQQQFEAVEQQISDQTTSPLERAILEDPNLRSSSVNLDLSWQAQQHAAEERLAVLDVFESSLVDLYHTPVERYYAIGMLAVELCPEFDNSVRRYCLRLTHGLERLRFVLPRLEEIIALTRAQKVANQITSANDERDKDLAVGAPSFPAWAKQIRKGHVVEYYWNEEWGWCRGTIVAEPRMVVDELLLTVEFEEDGLTYTLPLTAEEKVRWRPAS